MRNGFKSKAGWLWVVVPLALPNCVLNRYGTGSGVATVFNPGPLPHTNAIFCDIESISTPRHCVSQADVDGNGVPLGVSLAHAAITLVRKEKAYNVGLDYSEEARIQHGCATNEPAVAISYQSLFPDGKQLCLNCAGVIGPVYVDVDAACRARCVDLNGEGSEAFCADPEHAHASTNTNSNTNSDGGYDNACTNAGAPLDSFQDPRRKPDPVNWVSHQGTAEIDPDNNTLIRTAATTVPVSAFDAGAASNQTVTRGDAYVEFIAVQTNKTRMLGFAMGTTPDWDPSLNDIDFAISLSSDGHVFVVENGTPVCPDINNPLCDSANPTDGSFSTYSSGDHMRVMVTENPDHTARVEYFIIPAMCAENGCLPPPFYTSAGQATYPLRVDASLREMGAALNDVRLVWIH